jgi:hypothetical protein
MIRPRSIAPVNESRLLSVFNWLLQHYLPTADSQTPCAHTTTVDAGTRCQNLDQRAAALTNETVLDPAALAAADTAPERYPKGRGRAE